MQEIIFFRPLQEIIFFSPIVAREMGFGRGRFFILENMLVFRHY